MTLIIICTIRLYYLFEHLDSSKDISNNHQIDSRQNQATFFSNVTKKNVDNRKRVFIVYPTIKQSKKRHSTLCPSTNNVVGTSLYKIWQFKRNFKKRASQALIEFAIQQHHQVVAYAILSQAPSILRTPGNPMIPLITRNKLQNSVQRYFYLFYFYSYEKCRIN